MRPTTTDPTAGKRARRIRAFQGMPQRIVDPTDPRCRGDSAHGVNETRPLIFDPTNPRCEELAA